VPDETSLEGEPAEADAPGSEEAKQS
jgi:hypothetical protein